MSGQAATPAQETQKSENTLIVYSRTMGLVRWLRVWQQVIVAEILRVAEPRRPE